jgi:hypothetical protein
MMVESVWAAGADVAEVIQRLRARFPEASGALKPTREAS